MYRERPTRAVGNEMDLFAGPETPGTATFNQDRAAGTGRCADADSGSRAPAGA